MDKLYLNDYLSQLHRQISGSVEKIKRNSGTFERQDEPKNENWGGTGQQGIENYAYKLLDSGVSYQLLGYGTENRVNTAYAAASYGNAGQVLREPTVLIDFMFKNNREFDFKV